MHVHQRHPTLDGLSECLTDIARPHYLEPNPDEADADEELVLVGHEVPLGDGHAGELPEEDGGGAGGHQ